MTLSDGGRVGDLPRATVRRALYTMEQLGYVDSDGRLFRLTPQVLRLAGAYLGSAGNATALPPARDALCRDFDEARSAAVLDGHLAVMTAPASPSRCLLSAPCTGLLVPAFCSPVARVPLAGLLDAPQPGSL